jgi:hypothetical protein
MTLRTQHWRTRTSTLALLALYYFLHVHSSLPTYLPHNVNYCESLVNSLSADDKSDALLGMQLARQVFVMAQALWTCAMRWQAALAWSCRRRRCTTTPHPRRWRHRSPSWWRPSSRRRQVPKIKICVSCFCTEAVHIISSSVGQMTFWVHAEGVAVASAELEARPQRLVRAPAANRSRDGGSFTSEVVGVACRFPGDVSGQQSRQGSVYCTSGNYACLNNLQWQAQ